MTGRCWPANFPHEQIPWMAEGISMDEWRRRQTREELVDPILVRDAERARKKISTVPPPRKSKRPLDRGLLLANEPQTAENLERRDSECDSDSPDEINSRGER